MHLDDKVLHIELLILRSLIYNKYTHEALEEFSNFANRDSASKLTLSQKLTLYGIRKFDLSNRKLEVNTHSGIINLLLKQIKENKADLRYLKDILNNKIISSLEPEYIPFILETTVKGSNKLLQRVMIELDKEKAAEALDIIFNSELFSKLTPEERYKTFFPVKGDNKYQVIPLSLDKGLFDELHKHLSDKEKLSILSDINIMEKSLLSLYSNKGNPFPKFLESLPSGLDKDVLDYAYHSLFLYSHEIIPINRPSRMEKFLEVIKNLPYEQAFKLFYGSSKNPKSIIAKVSSEIEYCSSNFKHILESEAFQKLPEQLQIKILKYYHPISAVGKLLKDDNLKCLEKVLGVEILRKVAAELIGAAENKALKFITDAYDLNMLVDQYGFPASYHLSQAGIGQKGMKKMGLTYINMPKGYHVKFYPKYNYYYSDYATKTAIVFRGLDPSKVLADSPSAHLLLLKGYNVVLINNQHDLITLSEMDSILKEYSNDTSILVLEAHGDPNPYEKNEHIMLTGVKLDYGSPLYIRELSKEEIDELVTIKKYSKTHAFLSHILKILDKPIEVLLTSCYGQLLTRYLEDMYLPRGTKLTILSEYQTLDTSLEIYNNNQLDSYNLFNNVLERKDIDHNNFSLLKLIPLFLCNLIYGKNSPTFIYKDNEVKAHSMIKLVDEFPEYFTADSLKGSKDKVIKDLCGEVDDLCIQSIDNLIGEMSDKQLSTNYLKELRNTDSPKYGETLAIISDIFFMKEYEIMDTHEAY